MTTAREAIADTLMDLRTTSAAERLVLILRNDDELAARDAEIEIPKIQAEAVAIERARIRAAMYQALRDALEAGPTPGPWFRQGNLINGPDNGGIDIGFLIADVYEDGPHPTAAYIAAASPDVIAALLAERDALAAVAEAARDAVAQAEHSTTSRLWLYEVESLRAALAAYDRAVSK